ncbi:MAG: alpha/beta hydrolase [Sphingobium sp.]
MDSPALLSPAIDRRAWPMGGRLDYWDAPDGWPLRRYRLGKGGRGRMLVLGGRGDMIEKYLEPIHHWASRGWSVTSFDWRGQGGSGRMTDDPLCGHVDSFATWIADLRALSAEWCADEDEGPSVIVAHSMGGHLLLRALMEGLTPPDAIVLSAPMLGLNTRPLTPGTAQWIAAAMARLRFGKSQAWTQRHSSARQQALRLKRLTHDPERYADELWWRDHSREIALGAPSWTWVGEALESTAALEADMRLDQLNIPMLILATSADRLISTPAIRRIAARLPNARLHVYGEEAAHEILRELDPVRLDAFGRIDRFLDEVAP